MIRVGAVPSEKALLFVGARGPGYEVGYLHGTLVGSYVKRHGMEARQRKQPWMWPLHV